MLEGIDEIDWAGLRTACGDGAHLPGLLRAVASGDPVLTEEAIPYYDLALEWGLVRDAGVYPATAAAVPFLVELAADPGVLVPDQALAAVAVAAVFEGQSGDRPHGVRRAVATQVPALVDFLDHEDALLRVNAATALGHCDPPHVPTGAILNACRLDEPDPRVRAALLASSVACDPTNGRDWVVQAYRDDDPGVRAAALYAGARLGLPWTRHTTQVLHDCLTGADPLPASEYWFWDLRWWLLVVVDHLEESTRREVLRALYLSPCPRVGTIGLEVADHLLRQARHATTDL